MSDRISSLKLFTRVARTGSFTKAGKESGLSQPSVSRIISKLEDDLGAKLFVRSTHAIRLTDAGADYLARLDPILASLEEANHLVRGTGELKGHLRVGSAMSFAMREIIPRLPDFLEPHPDLKVDLVVTDAFQDLIGDAIDVALRFGPLRDSTMVARKLIETPRVLAASPGYIERAGVPRTPSELADHRVVLGPSSSKSIAWNFTKDGETTSVRVDHRLMITVNEATTSAALAGMGIVSSSLIACRAEIESGALVRLLPDWTIGTVPVHALFPGGRQAKASARAFVDFLAASFERG